MKLSKSNLILLVITLLVILLNIILLFNKGCVPNQNIPGSCFEAMPQVKIFGLPFASFIIIGILYPLAFSLIISLIYSSFVYSIKKDKDSAINIFIRAFTILFIVAYIISFYLFMFN